MKNRLNSKDGFLILFGVSGEYVKRIAPLFLFSAFLFTFSFVMGFYLGEDLDPSALEELAGVFPDIENTSILGLFAFIVINNIGKSLLFMLLGLILSVPPTLFVIINGFFIGWLTYSVSLERDLGFVILALLPHGIVEVPAILMSMSMGMGLGYQVINKIRGLPGLGEEWRNAWSLYLWRIAPLLIIAAILEVTLTPLVLALSGCV